jgi:predicted dehydrogenase
MRQVKLRCGVAGFGKMGRLRSHHISQRDDIEIVGIYDPEDPFQKPNAENFNFVNSFDELLSLNLDAIFICAFNDVNAKYSIKSLKAGVHVFCEKPPARDSIELLSVIQEEKKSNLILQYGFNHREHYSIIEAKKIISSGDLGRLLWVRGVYGKAGSIDYDSNWRNFKKYSGGGILIDQGIHMLDLYRYLTGLEFEVVSGLLTKSYWQTEVEDNAFITLRSGEIVATLHSSANQWRHKFLLEMHFQEGYLLLDGILSESRSYAPETLVVGKREFEDISFAMGKPAETKTWYEYDDSWMREIENFFEAVKNGRSKKNSSSSDALKVMQLIEDIYSKSGFYD